MTRRTKTFVIVAIVYVIALVLILGVKALNGRDLFDENQRLMLGLSLVCALYVALRGGILLERFLHRRGADAEATEAGKPSWMFWKGNHAIDHRMAERRKRVEAAKARQAQDDNEEAG